MKTLFITVIFIVLSTFLYSQHLNFEELESIDKRISTFLSYKDSKGIEIKEGDTLILLKPETDGTFSFVYFGNDLGGYKKVDRIAQGKEIVVENIRVTKFKSTKYVNLKCTEEGLVGAKYMISWEQAINAKEAKKKGAISKEEAINILKEKKDLLDLGLIKQNEYDSLLNLYKPIITGN